MFNFWPRINYIKNLFANNNIPKLKLVRVFGASLVEYGLLVSLIAVISLKAVEQVGHRTACTFCIVSFCANVTQVGDSNFTYFCEPGHYRQWLFDNCIRYTGQLDGICRLRRW